MCICVISCANVRSSLMLLHTQLDALFLASMKRIAAQTGEMESTSLVRLTRQPVPLLLMRNTNVLWSSR